MIDQYERKIIELTQAGLPLVEKPFQWIAEQINSSETDVIQSVKQMQQLGIIRRIAVVPNHYALGYRFNAMTVWDVADNAIKSCGEKLQQLDFISHCYQRPRHLPEWPYNLFAMIHGKSQDEIEEKKAIIKTLLQEHCTHHQSLQSKRILKKTGFRLNTDKKHEHNQHV